VAAAPPSNDSDRVGVGGSVGWRTSSTESSSGMTDTASTRR
jgi:hypothetical protein